MQPDGERKTTKIQCKSQFSFISGWVEFFTAEDTEENKH
jgi:hypothetical protein